MQEGVNLVAMANAKSYPPLLQPPYPLSLHRLVLMKLATAGPRRSIVEWEACAGVRGFKPWIGTVCPFLALLHQLAVQGGWIALSYICVGSLKPFFSLMQGC